MFKNPKTRKRVSICMAVVCCMALLVGSFAFFTDRADADATATAGNINLVFTDTSLAAESTGDNVQAIDNVWTAGKLVVDGGVLNPGDVIDMDYKVANTGNKSIDVKQQIVLTSSVALTADAEEYTITVGGQNITPVKSNENKTLTYELEEIVLNGSIETEDGVSVTEQEYEIAMEFDRLAKNAFMDSTVTVELDIQAKQHRNTTDADWIEWATYEASVEQIAD